MGSEVYIPMPRPSTVAAAVSLLLFIRGATTAPAGEDVIETAVEDNLHNGEKDLPPSDSMDIFIRLDADFDMKLSAKELDDASLVAYFKPELGPNPGETLAVLDEDKDGMVSEEEFLIFADPRVERQFAEADFRVADADGDGYLTSGEFQKSGHALELIEMTKDQGAEPNLHKAFASMDRDGDKKVSHQEHIAVQGLDLFSRRDQNKDGRLSLKEYTEFDPSKDPNELASIFEELDADNDKKLSRTEARGLHQDDADKDDPALKSHEFHAIDHDSSGTIEYGEWVDFHTIHTQSNVQKADIDATFDRYDFDRDGKVSEAEFTQPVSSGAGE